jgi:hypothetical protein
MILVMDNVVPSNELDSLRQDALAQNFNDVEYDSHIFPGIGTALPFSKMEATVSQLVGSPIEVEMSFWKMGLAGENAPTWIHADSGCSQLAAIYYLSDSPGGTAFWKHKETGWLEIPKETDNAMEVADLLHRDTHNEAAWEQTDFIKGFKNRLVIYSSKVFHSRYPQEEKATTKEDGRLTWVCFFNVRGS